MATSWKTVEKLLASGSNEDTLAHLQSLDKILNTPSTGAPKGDFTVPGIDGNVFRFEYSRQPPLEDYHIGNLPNLETDDRDDVNKVDIGDTGKTLTMGVRDYVDVLECFSPIFADVSCLDTTKPLPGITPLPPTLPPSLTPHDILAALRGRSKEEVVPLLVGMDIPTETKVDLALQHFASIT